MSVRRAKWSVSFAAWRRIYSGAGRLMISKRGAERAAFGSRRHERPAREAERFLCRLAPDLLRRRALDDF